MNFQLFSINTHLRTAVVILLWGLAVLATAGPARADSVEVEVLRQECVAGEPLYFVIRVSLDQEAAVDVGNIRYQGRELPYEVGTQSSSSFTMIINGKTVRQSSSLIKSYTFELATEAPGSINLPATTITVGGREYPIRAMAFTVHAKPTSDNLLFLTEITNFQNFYYPSQVIEIACKIYFREINNPIIENISLPVLQHRAFTLIPAENANFEVPINGEPTRIFKESGQENYNGQRYNLFLFKLRFRLMEVGDFVFKNSLKMQVETGRTVQQRGFFSSRRVPERMPLYSDSPALAIEVAELPKENIPESFNGAIGIFNIRVTPSTDTDIKVGDPITLIIEISGRGTWDFVHAPPLHKISTITDYFKVSSDPVAGEISADGSTKTFRVRVRVKSKTVTEIPPIPFSYFDLVSQQYVTVYSDPVPIAVFGTATSAKIIDYSRPVLPDSATDQESGTAEDAPDFQTGMSSGNGELRAPVPEAVPIRDNVPSHFEEDHAPHYWRLLFAVLPLGLAAVLIIFKKMQQRGMSRENQIRETARNAYRNFNTQVTLLEKMDFEPKTFYRDLGRCLQQFVAERYTVTLLHVDKDVLAPLVDAGRLSQERCETLVSLVEKIEDNRYTGSGNSREDAERLVREIREVLKQC